jgi:hypothetical protein
MTIERYGNTRYWAVYASDGALICVCVYHKGVRHEAHDWNGWKIPRALPESP